MVALGLMVLVFAALFFWLIIRFQWIRRLCLIFIVLLFLGFSFGVIPIPLWVWQIVHLAYPPEDLYQPIVTDKFSFYERGYSKTYPLKPKYRDNYEVIISSSPDTIPSGCGKENRTYEFEGKIKFELFNHGEKVSDEEVTDWDSIGYQDKNMNYIKSICLYTFPVPPKGFSLDGTIIKITVVEPDHNLGKYENNIELQIRVSPTP